jgi:hypothetical protein
MKAGVLMEGFTYTTGNPEDDSTTAHLIRALVGDTHADLDNGCSTQESYTSRAPAITPCLPLCSYMPRYMTSMFKGLAQCPLMRGACCVGRQGPHSCTSGR